MIGVINYGLGNVQALLNIYHRLDIPAKAITSRSELSTADKLILPGVGSFDWAMVRLRSSGLLEPLEDRVLNEGAPVLGICVGMQILGSGSEEGELPGLNWIPGAVKRLPTESRDLPLPHMGWNSVVQRDNSDLFKDFPSVAEFYFLHSYYFEPAEDEFALALTQYGINFSSAIRRGRIFGAQFHPEKSHNAGVALLKNFAEL